jgi:hypothetical protein
VSVFTIARWSGLLACLIATVGLLLALGAVGASATPIPEQLVGAPGEPAFGSGWKNAGGGYQVAGFYRAGGIVHLRGVVDLGSSTTIFTLPAGYRPAATEAFGAVLDTAGTALIFVTAAGEVDLEFINSPSAAHNVSLSQISFRAGV